MAYVDLLGSNGSAYRYEISCSETVLGRAPYCAILLDASSVSRRHARIVVRGEFLELEDLESRNGTFLNGDKIKHRCQLRDGDQIRIVDFEFSFHAGPTQENCTHENFTTSAVSREEYCELLELAARNASKIAGSISRKFAIAKANGKVNEFGRELEVQVLRLQQCGVEFPPCGSSMEDYLYSLDAAISDLMKMKCERLLQQGLDFETVTDQLPFTLEDLISSMPMEEPS